MTPVVVMGWEELYWELTSNNYVHAVIILAISIVIARLVVSFFKKYIEIHVKKTKNKLDDKIVHRIETPIIAIILLVGAQLALRKIVMSTAVFENAINSIIVFVITYMFIGVSHVVIHYWEKMKKNASDEFHEEIMPLIKSLTKILMVMIATMIILQIWGVQVGTLLASLGIAGIILGFAFKDTLGNIFGGISLIVDNSIHKKDVIRLSDGQIGEVIEVNLRSTKLKTLEEDYLIIPNGILGNEKFVNLAQPNPQYRLIIPVNVVYGVNVKKTKEILMSVLKNRKDLAKSPKSTCMLSKLGEYSLEFNLYIYIKDYKMRYQSTDEITTDVYNALRKKKIEIAYPTKVVLNDKHK